MSRLTVNDRPVEFKLDSQTPLLWALRDAANLTGTKYGCGAGDCGACMVLIGQLKLAARKAQLDAETRRAKSRIMQRILVNDAEIRHLAEPWLGDLENMMGGKLKTIH